MSNCSNCYNGCTEIVSDRCVKYTGIDVPVLGIQTGDSLSFVEQALITFLTSTLDGTGIKPIVDDNIICDIVRQYLPTCGDLSLNDILSALIKATCTLQDQINAIEGELAELNGDYTLPVGCLTGVTASSDTHAILQAVINKLCALSDQFAQLLIDLPNTYVPINSTPGHPGINDYIQSYINSSTNANSISSKMVPFAVVAYFGPLTNFDSTGAGLNLTLTGGQDWTKIYICNGNNSTNDLRGWGLVGAISGVPGGPMSNVVNPSASPANPNYVLGNTYGANQITLQTQQIPVHTHTNTAITNIIPGTHNHSYVKTDQYNTPGNGVDIGYIGVGDDKHMGGSLVNTGDVTLTAETIMTNAPAPTGGGLPHPNIQPVTACYWIQYRP